MNFSFSRRSETEGGRPQCIRNVGYAWGWALLTAVMVSAWVYAVSGSILVQAELALSRGDFHEARLLALEQLRDTPRSDRALTVAGAASLALRDEPSAASYFNRVSARELELYAVAQSNLGQLALNAGRIIEAEEHLRAALRSLPDDFTAQDRLIYLLMLEGRSWEARALVLDQLRAGVVTSNYLIILGRHDRGLEGAPQFARHCLTVMPDEPLPRLVLAQKAWRENQPDAATEMLRLILVKHPDFVEAHALLGRIVVETESPDNFRRVVDAWPPSASNHPDTWLSRGIAAEQSGDQEVAVRCYWEALQRNPDLVVANYRLSQTLVNLGQPHLARSFADRAARLGKLSLEMSPLSTKGKLDALRSIVLQLESLGRYWEAAGWCRAMLQESSGQPRWAMEVESRLSAALSANSPLTMTSLNPAETNNFSGYPLSRLQRRTPSAEFNSGSDQPGKIVFQDDSVATGLLFTYRNGARDDHLESMTQMNGGGIAVLDYDGDGWVDVFFTQGGNLPPAPFDGRNRDQIFRNMSGGRNPGPGKTFIDVTDAAELKDTGYGQGVTVGDFDNDGFPDLYVGNIGSNHFHRNNGDGTFSDVTASTTTQAGGWTSSCVLADITNDGLPDLYVVRYLDGDAIYQPCDKRVRPRCSPLLFKAAEDRVYINSGDGGFEEQTGRNGLVDVDGRGLGVVAADFDSSHKLSLFVANDMTANFYFVNRIKSTAVQSFEERALLSGLAFDYDGKVKSCMGVAAGDSDGDGRLDLFITNFYRESNDLYLQQPDGTFRDSSRAAKLFDPSFLMLGWGTQFLDADLDGQQDLIVANGHVHEPSDTEIAYRMPAQFFRNSGHATFMEIPAQQLGNYFERPHLGRALAKLDWDRDGREDVCISSLDEPVALLTNRSGTSGRFLSLRLVAVNSARDAIGTKVLVAHGEATVTQQLSGGDGFHASNERRLTFGFDASETHASFEVDWASGFRQQYHNLTLNTEWILVENREPVQVSNRH